MTHVQRRRERKNNMEERKKERKKRKEKRLTDILIVFRGRLNELAAPIRR